MTSYLISVFQCSAFSAECLASIESDFVSLDEAIIEAGTMLRKRVPSWMFGAVRIYSVKGRCIRNILFEPSNYFQDYKPSLPWKN